jgi:integrase
MKLKRNAKRSRNYYAVWTDEHGIQRQRTTGTSIRKLAAEIGAKWEADARRVREGLVDPAQLAQRDAARLPIGRHLEDYLEWCRASGQSPDGLRTKEVQIRGFLEAQGCATLRDVTPALLVRHMKQIVGTGRAPRTANLTRMNVVAFLNWCRDDRRISGHDITRRTAPKLDEAQDCRRRRRALTAEELERLRMASLPSGRWWTYQLAIWTGLRRGELAQLRWTDLDLEAGELRVRASISKNGQDATLPILPPAAESLEALRRLNPDSELVVPRVPAKESLYVDLELAGIQGRTRTGSCAPNAAGERVDFHALRTTCATMLALAGVPTLHLKRFMRHSSIAMTDRHYTKLRTTDLRAELERAMERPVALAATGTDGLTPKLTPTTATNGAIRGVSGYKVSPGNRGLMLAASAGPWGDYDHPSASGGDHAKTPRKHGPVAQRPTADGEIPDGKAGSAGGLTPKLTPQADSDPEEARLLLLIEALSPRALERLRGLLAAP